MGIFRGELAEKGNYRKLRFCHTLPAAGAVRSVTDPSITAGPARQNMQNQAAKKDTGWEEVATAPNYTA